MTRFIAPASLLSSVALAAAITGCEPEGEIRAQWLVHVGTDAPLPGFGDRIRVDVLDEKGVTCATCSRVFDTQSGQSLPLSFGVAPDSTAHFVRARLYRAENTTSGGDPEDPLIDVLGALPALAEDPLSVKVWLGMSCFGKPVDLEAFTSCDPNTGELVTSLPLETGSAAELPQPGSWGGGDIDCEGAAPAGMVCVPGGVFLLGSRAFAPFGPDFDPVPEQLVQLPPFFIDVDELTVARSRELVALGALPPKFASAEDARCAYTARPGDQEDASVNCISRETAALLCQQDGKRLPTEAEWELASSNRDLGSPFPWLLEGEVDTDVICRTAVVARGDLGDLDASRQCVVNDGVEPGPVAGGSASDVSGLGIKNLGGNLSEWVSDDFARYADEICWGSEIELLEDPQCVADPSLGVLRGGSWLSFTYNTHAFFRRSAPSGLEPSFVGVRCARDGG